MFRNFWYNINVIFRQFDVSSTIKLFFQAAEEYNIRGGPENPKTVDSEDNSDVDSDDAEDSDDADNDLDETEQVSQELTTAPAEDRLNPPVSDMSATGHTDDNSEGGNDRVIGNVVSAKDEDSVSGSDEEDLEDLRDQNRTLRPFRNEESLTHTNLHRRKHLDSTSVSVASTTSSMDPRLVKEKVKQQMKKKAAVKEARRIRKSGESAIITKKQRDISQDIKQSVDAGWY